MSGTRAGGLQARDTNKQKYGKDFYSRIGAIGGSVTDIPKGFGKEDRTLLERILKKPRHHAQSAGRKGGYTSRRGKK